jgi:hypothetical protein
MKPNDTEINTDPVNTLRCLSSFDLWYYLKKLNILKVIKALKKTKMLKEFKRTKAINISRQATGVWFKRCCVQLKSLPLTSHYQGVNLCQTTLLLEQPAGVSLAFNAMPSQSAQSNNAEHLLQRVKPSAASMAGVAPARVQKQAGQGAGLPTGFMEIQPVRRAQH